MLSPVDLTLSFAHSTRNQDSVSQVVTSVDVSKNIFQSLAIKVQKQYQSFSWNWVWMGLKGL